MENMHNQRPLEIFGNNIKKCSRNIPGNVYEAQRKHTADRRQRDGGCDVLMLFTLCRTLRRVGLGINVIMACLESGVPNGRRATDLFCVSACVFFKRAQAWMFMSHATGQTRSRVHARAERIGRSNIVGWRTYRTLTH